MFQRNHPERIEPSPGQESVWDYPRPPIIDEANKPVRVVFNGVIIAESERALRVLETSQAPGYYIPREDVLMTYFSKTASVTACEWKGLASYYDLTVKGKTAKEPAWSYESPVMAYERIKGYLAFYPQRVDACYVGDEQVKAMDGNFYGGWITSEIVGPIKGARGTLHW